MKNAKSKFFIVFLSAICVAVFCLTVAYCTTSSGNALDCDVALASSDFQSVGKSAYLVDYATGSVIYAKNENERYPIASMVKIMTSLLVFEAIDRGECSFDDDVAVSSNASSMGGSQVFLEANTTHKLDNLLKAVIVASANDACVALAEHISGDISTFVSCMNARANELGMSNTNYKNCTGLPAPESFSSAKDVSIVFSQLIKHPKYFEYAKVWLEDYEHPDGRKTTITNTNKLVKFYNGCDGGKTGFTSEAKFCLSATAMRNDMRVIAVVIGAESAKVRNWAVSGMFDYAFANYSNKILLKAGENLENSIAVSGGKKDKLAITVQNDVTQFMSKQDSDDYALKFDIKQSVSAPIKKGDIVGKVYLTKGGVVVSQTNVVANEQIDRLSLFDAIDEIAKHWNIAKR